VKNYDSTVARIAGNLLSGQPGFFERSAITGRGRGHSEDLIIAAVEAARAIVAETIRTEPAATNTTPKVGRE
jgi:hypothetical protein